MDLREHLDTSHGGRDDAPDPDDLHELSAWHDLVHRDDGSLAHSHDPATPSRHVVPHDFEVQPVNCPHEAQDPATCGTCGLTWDDAVVTSMTPAPSGRCPFEPFHVEEDAMPPDVAFFHEHAGWSYDPAAVDTLAFERLSPDTYIVKRHLSGITLTVFLPVAAVEAVPGPAPLHPEFEAEAEGFRVEQRRKG